MNCGNCGAALSCGCQKRVATNGKQCCTNCISSCNQAAGAGATPKQNKPIIRPRGPFTGRP